jgi:hypothetical protein
MQQQSKKLSKQQVFVWSLYNYLSQHQKKTEELQEKITSLTNSNNLGADMYRQNKFKEAKDILQKVAVHLPTDLC